MDQLSHFIMNHWMLWLAFILILALTFIYELVMQKKKAKQLTPQSAVALINNEHAVVIDLRDKDLFQSGHIIDSVNASATDFDKPKLNKYKNKPVILACARGLQSPAVAAKIRTQGFEVFVLGGGIEGWLSADLPLIKGK